MLAGYPVKCGWYCHTNKTTIVHGYLSLLRKAVLKAGAKPRVGVTGNIDCSCCNKVVPVEVLVSFTTPGQVDRVLPRGQGVVAVPKERYHEYYSSE
jgi:hypothetical protein